MRTLSHGTLFIRRRAHRFFIRRQCGAVGRSGERGALRKRAYEGIARASATAKPAYATGRSGRRRRGSGRRFDRHRNRSSERSALQHRGANLWRRTLRRPAGIYAGIRRQRPFANDAPRRRRESRRRRISVHRLQFRTTAYRKFLRGDFRRAWIRTYSSAGT